MSEPDLVTAYARLTGGPAPDPIDVRRRIDRRRTARRRLVAASAALGVVVVTGAAVGVERGLRADGPPVAPTSPSGSPTGSPTLAVPGWQRVASPLSPRTDSLVATVGGEVIVIGGAVADLCPPNADCARPDTYAVDGAAYDPATGVWRAVADAPEPVAGWTRFAVAGDRLVLVLSDEAGEDVSWWSYAPAADAWSPLPSPPGRLTATASLSAVDGRVYALDGAGPVRVLDPIAGTWTSLPASPIRPALVDRTLSASPAGVVVSGLDATGANDGRAPSYVLVDVWDGTSWRRLPPTGQLGNFVPWTWTGSRLVAVDPTCADGGQVDPFPSCLPFGGTLDSAGIWSRLASVPRRPSSGGWSVTAVDDGSPLAATYGYVYDDRDGSWVRLPEPAGAPQEPGGATWADGRLFVLGGVTWARGGARLSDDLWIWTRGGGTPSPDIAY